MKKCLLLLALPLLLSSCRFYEVDPGRLYRSPQPSAADIERYVNENGIKTIINLRGESVGSRWYDQELAAANQYGVKLVNIGMSAKRLPHRKDLIKLLDTFETAQKPMLVHCMAGVDRTGEASAIYEMLYMGKTKEIALEMLTPLFGHFEQIMPAKRYFIRDLWVDEAWAREIYDPCEQNYKYYDKKDPACGSKSIPQNEIANDLDGDT